MGVIFETERMIVRDWVPAQDVHDALEMYSNPKVLRFLGRDPKPVTSIDEQRERLEQRVATNLAFNDGTGFWALERKDTGEVIGAVVAKWLPDGEGKPTPEMEIGWHLKESVWGHGYATEAGAGAAKYGFEILKAPILYAVVNAENFKSIAVTQRLGMKPLGPTDKYYGTTLELFYLEPEL